MKLFRILTAFILSSTLTISTQAQNTYVNSGNPTTYNLNNGDSLYIQNGTFTGTINTFAKNAKITIAAGAGFQPSSFNNPKGVLKVYGNATFSSLNTNEGFDLENRGVVEITGSTNMNGGNQTWNIYYGATLKFGGSVTMNSGSVMTNEGTITGNSTFTMNNGSTFTNKNLVTLNGSLTVNGATLSNQGKLESNNITFNSGSTFSNSCRMISDGSITINNITLNNDGLIWIPAQYTTASITNSGTINNTANGKIKVRNFTNYGTITGKGYYYFLGSTYNSGTVGVSGSTTDTIKIYDATRTSSSTIFDVQYGTVRANAVFASFAAPDTVFAYSSCATQYSSMMAALPVKWNFFYVNVSNNTPVISWSSEQDETTVFDVQRSYDGTNFSSIYSITSQPSNSNYTYNDVTVNTQNTIVYYRIKATELSGEQKFTEIKTVRFSNKQGVAIQTSPNPFTSQFSINYQSEEKGLLVVKIYNMNGQLQVTKSASVNKGYNSIAVTEASSLAKGFYMVQLTINNNMVATEKLVKQ